MAHPRLAKIFLHIGSGRDNIVSGSGKTDETSLQKIDRPCSGCCNALCIAAGLLFHAKSRCGMGSGPRMGMDALSWCEPLRDRRIDHALGTRAEKRRPFPASGKNVTRRHGHRDRSWICGRFGSGQSPGGDPESSRKEKDSQRLLEFLRTGKTHLGIHSSRFADDLPRAIILRKNY